MADSNYIIASLNAMAKATQASLKIIMGKIEYRQLRNRLIQDVNSDDSPDAVLRRVAENLTNRQNYIQELSKFLQESCNLYLDYLESFTNPVLESDVSLAIKQVDLFISSDKRNDEDIIGYVVIPTDRLNAIINRLESLSNDEQMRNLISLLKKWAAERNELNDRVEERERTLEHQR